MFTLKPFFFIMSIVPMLGGRGFINPINGLKITTKFRTIICVICTNNYPVRESNLHHFGKAFVENQQP